MLLRGEIQHKNLWLVDLDTGTERQLTNFPAAFEVRDFDISPDGREVVARTRAGTVGRRVAGFDEALTHRKRVA